MLPTTAAACSSSQVAAGDSRRGMTTYTNFNRDIVLARLETSLPAAVPTGRRTLLRARTSHRLPRPHLLHRLHRLHRLPAAPIFRPLPLSRSRHVADAGGSSRWRGRCICITCEGGPEETEVNCGIVWARWPTARRRGRRRRRLATICDHADSERRRGELTHRKKGHRENLLTDISRGRLGAGVAQGNKRVVPLRDREVRQYANAGSVGMRLRSYSGDKFFHYSRATAQAMPAHLWLGRIRLVALEFMGLLDLSADNNGHVYIDHNALGRVQFASWLKNAADSAELDASAALLSGNCAGIMAAAACSGRWWRSSGDDGERQ